MSNGQMSLPRPVMHQLPEMSWMTRSSSNPDQVHVTYVNFDGVECTCQGFKAHQHCWHSDKVREEMGIE